MNKEPKKRGRKPKGGKIITPVEKDNSSTSIQKPNIILHLKCNSKNLNNNNNNSISNTNYNPNIESIQSYDYYNNNQFFNLDNNKNINNSINDNNKNAITSFISSSSRKTENKPNILIKEDDSDDNNNFKTTIINNKQLWKKISLLNQSFHHNEICNKKSSCFWCTCSFNNPTIYIPKQYTKNNYEVYGCFCSPECATAYLFNENIDNSVKWNRYYLLNHLYAKHFNYKKNIKPAPSPYYLLDKYYGTLSIDEYRQLLNDEKMILVIDKPMTKILPEIFEDNNEFINNTSIHHMNTNKTNITNDSYIIT